MRVMSNERMRVASSDWCASRIVVSVNSTCFCAFIQLRARRPLPSSTCRVPSMTISGSYSGTTGAPHRRAARPVAHFGMAVDGDVGDVGQQLGRPVLPALRMSNSAGVVSMKRVV
jgi:hypothetical protein